MYSRPQALPNASNLRDSDSMHTSNAYLFHCIEPTEGFILRGVCIFSSTVNATGSA